MDNMTGDIRIVREKVDETNVRLGTITQELESIRDAMPQPGGFQQAPIDPATTPGSSPTTSLQQPTSAPPAGINAQRLFEGSWADYTAGAYDLAIKGFEQYIGLFPKGARAHEAQLLIGESLAWQKKDMDAVGAYDRVIANYPGSASAPTAYYKRGMAFERLGEAARARESYEALTKQFPDSPPATLAKQRLEGLTNRPTAR
jgi:tol-pal system protein YbgF